MASTKKASKKSPVKVKSTETEEVVDIISIKSKKIEDPEEVEAFLPEEKVEDETVADDDAEELADEIGLDTEEINPFGDKWEE